MQFTMHSIGRIHSDGESFSIELEPQYRSALTGLEGFGYVQVLWWFSETDDTESRRNLIEKKPYVKGPETIGVFATRSPHRPNPIAISAAQIIDMDISSGIIVLAWIDAHDNTPVLDIKPYTPSADRLESPTVPQWCAHWPKSIEESAEFDWDSEFNF